MSAARPTPEQLDVLCFRVALPAALLPTAQGRTCRAIPRREYEVWLLVTEPRAGLLRRRNDRQALHRPAWPRGGIRCPRARTYVRALDSEALLRDHVRMPASPRCGALLRNGQPCGRTAAADSDFCVHHTKLLETVDAEALRLGLIPKKCSPQRSTLRVVSGATTKPPTATAAATNADPATVRPSLAAAAAENVEALTASLLEAAAAATKPAWITVECSGCGARSQVEAPVPDVRARVAAIELLLREGLGRPATAEEVHAPRTPSSVAAVSEMSWEEMQALFAATYVDEIAAVQRSGGAALVREKLLALTDGERHALRHALLELDAA
jgi:hypothetical protein